MLLQNWGNFALLQIGQAYILQIRAIFITNQGNPYYKLGQTLLQVRAANTNWGNY